MADAAPIYVDMVLWAVYVLLVLTIAAAVYSAFHGVRTHGRQVAESRLIHRAATGAIAVPVVEMAVSYALASTKPLTINGHAFDSVVWLRLTDMFIFTSITLIIVCFAIVIATKFRR